MKGVIRLSRLVQLHWKSSVVSLTVKARISPESWGFPGFLLLISSLALEARLVYNLVTATKPSLYTTQTTKLTSRPRLGFVCIILFSFFFSAPLFSGFLLLFLWTFKRFLQTRFCSGLMRFKVCVRVCVCAVPAPIIHVNVVQF